jgi:iron complex outermembrane receptor protein
MSKIMNTRDNQTSLRWQLLATVSAMALAGSAYGAGKALAADSDNPQVWIELGGQLSRLDDGQEIFAPPLMAVRPTKFAPSQEFQRPPLYGFDENGKLSFQPEGSDWVFSASMRYGRSSSDRHFHQQSSPGTIVIGSGYFKHYAAQFADTVSHTSEKNTLLDFQAGKDVGLGMFGDKDGSSIVSVGVRFAQFRTNSNVSIKSDPDWHISYKYFYGLKIPQQSYHSNRATMQAERSFRGVGPSLSWNASAPFAGDTQNGELTFDWGVNAALLFGRQRVKVHHQTTGEFHGKKYYTGYRAKTYQPTPVNRTHTKSITVPNIGGFAGISYRYSDAKLSLGYRGDFFFGAIDGGIDTRKSEDRAFFGPYASISVGLGD